MNSATNLVRGFSCTSRDVPICWMTASLITMTLSASDIASCCECVTMMKVMFSSRCTFFNSIIIAWRRLKSSDPSGSSSRSTVGLLISARAKATRCCWPPDRPPGRRSAKVVSPTISSISHTRRSRAAFSMPFIFRLNSTFWNTVRWGNSAKLWNIIEVSRRAGGRSVTSFPAMTIVPSDTSSRPPIIRNVVVLPQPDGPSMATNSPCSISALKSMTARAPPG